MPAKRFVNEPEAKTRSLEVTLAFSNCSSSGSTNPQKVIGAMIMPDDLREIFSAEAVVP